MSLQLRVEWRGSKFPPNGYPYVDAKTGFKFDAMAGNLEYRIKDVRKHRLANPNVYSDKKYLDEDFIRQEIIEFMCHKTPEICQEGGDVDLSLTPPADPSKMIQDKACPNCHSMTNAHPVFCASCGNGRLKHWLCSCGMKF